MPWKQWAYLEKVSSADFQAYVQDQVIPQFTNAAQRTTQMPAPKDGQLSYTQDNKQLWLWNGTTWRLAVPHSQATRRTFSVEATITNPAAYQPLSAGADRTALTITFTKYAADTVLIFQGTAQWAVSSGVSGQRQSFGIRRDAGGAGLDYDIAQTTPTGWGITAPFRLWPFTGTAQVTGVPAGTYTFQPVFKASGGIVMNFYPSDDFIGYSVTETY